VKAALYARYSTDKQSEASVEDQFRVCERVAEREGLEIVERFHDRGISGGTAQRPGYQSMLAAARRDAFQVIIAEDVERIWRNRAESGPRSAEWEDLGIHLLTAVGDDTRRTGWGLLIQIKQAIGEESRKQASYRTRRGQEGNALAGKPTGGRAYGYIAARDSGTGLIEIDVAEAATVRRIFEMYADGMSPRSIAARLNEEGVPSPGAKWKRTNRRTDGKWLATAIHGDVNRGTGILNNRRYAGVMLWGRSEWKRSAADSAKRMHRQLAKALVERADERLRIVPGELWDRAKARQSANRHVTGERVRGGARRNKAGAGPPARYMLSGLLRCAICDARYVMANKTRYQCASHVNGSACTNGLSVDRVRVEATLLRCVHAELLNPRKLEQAESQLQTFLAQPATPIDRAPRISQLQGEIANIGDAIASGAFHGSPMIAQRLQAAEAELARLQAAAVQPRRTAGRHVSRSADERCRDVAARIAAGGDEGRAVLAGLFSGRVDLVPDRSGRYLWAQFECDIARLFDISPETEFEDLDAVKSAIMVAGVGFEPTTFGL
jgi:site-specific DNA recombinase